MTEISADHPSGEPARFTFDAAPEDVQALVLRQGALGAFSLGLYRFWMKTRLRRLFWGRTALGGDRFEYAGTAWELVIGTILVIALFAAGLLAAGFALSFFDLAIWRGRLTWGTLLVCLLTFLPLVQFAKYRARRYRLLRTRWRGLRFGMEGSGLGFVWLWLRWFALTALTLGVLWPWLRVARERYMTERSYYGDAKFRFDAGPRGRFEGGAWPLMRAWTLVMLSALIAVGGYLMLTDLASRATLIARLGGVSVNLTLVLYWLGLFGLAYFVFHTWCAYRAEEVRLFMAARRVRAVEATCRFGARGLRRAFWAMAGRGLGVGLIVAVGLVAFASLMLQLAVVVDGGDPKTFAFSLDPSNIARFETAGGRAVFAAAIWINYALTVLFFMWLWTAVYVRRVHAHFCETTTVAGLASLAGVRQRTKDDRYAAEGFADALDVGGL